MIGVSVKRERAQAHLDELGKAVESFMQENAHRVFTDLYLDEGEAVAISGVEDWRREETWGAILGDVVHNLRSSLDHLTYQLACLVRDPPKCKTEFPIFWELGKFKNARIGCLAKCDRDRMLYHQPFTRYPDDPKSHPLWSLHQLDVDDKHNVLNVTAVVASFRTLTPVCRDLEIVGATEFPRQDSLKSGAVLARYKVRQTGPNPEIHVNAEGTFSVVLGKGTGAEYQGLFKTAYAIRDAVSVVTGDFSERFR